MEIERVQTCLQVATFFLVPYEGWAVVSEVVGEWCHVVRRVCESQHVVTHKVAGRLVAESQVVALGRDDRELFDDVPVQMRALGLLPHNKVDDTMADDLRVRPVAIQCVHARDPVAAVSLATRKLSITLECLNFFADVISYNRHLRGPDGARRPIVLRIGESGPAIALQVALAADGSFWENRQATKLGTFSLERVHGLPSLAGEAVKRVEELLAHEVRDPVEELLLRAVRWVGRATAAESPEDQVLFSEIALECLTRPGMDRHTKKELVSQTAAILDRSGSDGGSIEDEIARLYGIRSELVHDGSREISESDSTEMYEIALAVTLSLLVSPEVKQVKTLGALDELLKLW